MYGIEILHRRVVLLFVIFCCIAVKLGAQNPQPIQGTQVIVGKNALPSTDSLIAREIDAQVWRRFITAYNLFDAESFNVLHVQDVLRGGPWGLRVGDDYLQRNINDNQWQRQSGVMRSISLVFEHRVHSPDIAYEVGYYRVVRKQKDVGESESYGQFHVVLKKLDGKWKIVQDWDAPTIAGMPVTAEHFQKYAAKGILE